MQCTTVLYLSDAVNVFILTKEKKLIIVTVRTSLIFTLVFYLSAVQNIWMIFTQLTQLLCFGLITKIYQSNVQFLSKETRGSRWFFLDPTKIMPVLVFTWWDRLWTMNPKGWNWRLLNCIGCHKSLIFFFISACEKLLWRYGRNNNMQLNIHYILMVVF